MKDIIGWLIASALVAALVACGGGGGGGGSSTGGGGTSSTAPGVPTAVVATAGNASASVAFTAPASDGGSPIAGYTATCGAGGSSSSGTGLASPIVVNGLVNGMTYACAVVATNAVGTGPASSSAAVTPLGKLPPSGGFSLTSPVGADGGTLPVDYTCDGTGSTVALNWSNPPIGTREYALLMTTLPGDGTTKWNWVPYGIPGNTANLIKDAFGVGTLGVGSDGPGNPYDPPCTQGPGTKVYTYTVYALSGSPVIALPASQVTGKGSCGRHRLADTRYGVAQPERHADNHDRLERRVPQHP